ncbi:MAG: hypothetical protein HYZ14_19325 [Bacteroidetes bacterium]|nr:hypothetical protein [Bacteroidota bacterium]
MKKSILMLAAGALLLATPSCKKGENDPFLSLSSRKARVAGEWDVTGYTFTSTNTESNGDSQSSNKTMSGDVITSTYSDFDQSSGTTTTSTSTTTLNDGSYTFEKDGTYKATWNTTTVSVQTQDWFGVTYTYTYTTVSTWSESGNWSFVGKVKDEYKNKERIVVNTTSTSSSNQTTTVETNSANSTVVTTNGDLNASTNTYHSGEMQATFEIDQLKGKEMILKMMESDSGTNSVTPYGGSTTTSADDVYTSDLTITLTIVK